MLFSVGLFSLEDCDTDEEPSIVEARLVLVLSISSSSSSLGCLSKLYWVQDSSSGIVLVWIVWDMKFIFVHFEWWFVEELGKFDSN